MTKLYIKVFTKLRLIQVRSFLIFLVSLGLMTSCDSRLNEIAKIDADHAIKKKLLPEGSYPQEKLPAGLSEGVRERAEFFASNFKNLKTQCPLLVLIYHDKDASINSLGYCVYTKNNGVGIYAAEACVGDLIDHMYQEPYPFYSEQKLHWGSDGYCTKESIVKKLQAPDTLTTENPITYLRMKIDEGFAIQVLQDRFGVSDVLKNVLINRDVALLMKREMLNDN